MISLQRLSHTCTRVAVEKLLPATDSDAGPRTWLRSRASEPIPLNVLSYLNLQQALQIRSQLRYVKLSLFVSAICCLQSINIGRSFFATKFWYGFPAA